MSRYDRIAYRGHTITPVPWSDSGATWDMGVYDERPGGEGDWGYLGIEFPWEDAVDEAKARIDYALEEEREA